ncbi:hypothetical protein J437_LFUL013545, partial [Ladona fulva]
MKTYHDCLAQIICNPPSVECFFQNCSECPGPVNLTDYSQGLFERHMIDKITYKKWLLKHSFVAREQSSHLKYRKENLQTRMFDFSENYSFVSQDAIQGVHWNNIKATFHPFVVYYRGDFVVESKSIVAISESIKHDAIAVHLFQRKLISFLKE